MRLLLVRHGESTWNAEGRYQGRKDAPLSDRGMAQANALAAYLSAAADDRPNAIASSPLSRARDTAEVAARALGLAVHVDPNLVEISHGAWEGLHKSDIAKRWPDMYAAWQAAPETVQFPGGESLADVKERWRSFLSGIDRFASPLLVVTHDVIVRLGVMDARGEKLGAFNTLTAENCAVTEIDLVSRNLHLIRLNDAAHLGAHRANAAEQAL